MTTGGAPGPDELTGWARARLFEQRVVLARGLLDDQLASEVAVQLMTLDAEGDEHVELHLSCPDGTIAAAFAVIDTMDLLGVPVHATCVGSLSGPPVGVLAAASWRRAAPHARLRLATGATTRTGTASELARFAREHQEDVEAFAARLAVATKRPLEHIEADLVAGRSLSAAEAIAYGLVDELWTPKDGSSRSEEP